MSTVLDRIIEELQSAAVSNGDLASPHVLIWPDRESVWADAIPLIAARFRTLILGEYDPEAGSGPAYWIRYVLATELNGKEEFPSLLTIQMTVKYRSVEIE